MKHCIASPAAPDGEPHSGRFRRGLATPDSRGRNDIRIHMNALLLAGRFLALRNPKDSTTPKIQNN